jgi:hypothetical protein
MTASDNSAVFTQKSVLKEQEYFPTDAAMLKASPEEAHFYAECSNAGECDRTTGQCKCFEGFTGAACQRMTCPNDCSGHGVCRTMEDVTSQALTRRDAGADGEGIIYTGVIDSFTYNNWDATKTRVCVCDGGYGGADCSERQCPRGDDPLTIEARHCGSEPCRDQTQTFTVAGAAATSAGDNTLASNVAIKYTHWTGITYTTTGLELTPGGSGDNEEPVQVAHWLESALEGLPDSVIMDVEVSCAYDDGSGACTTATDASKDQTYTITFKKPTGFLPDLTLFHQPVTTNSHLVARNYITMEPVTDAQRGNKERVECSARGVCDYDTGICNCFSGYYGDDCSIAAAGAKRGGTRRAAAAAPAAPAA